jgi:hypothetical protein
LLGVILQEGAPSLRGRFMAAHQVFADAALTASILLKSRADRILARHSSLNRANGLSAGLHHQTDKKAS